MSFWWKALEGTTWDSINRGQMLAYSSFVPPRVLFALDFYGNGQKINYWPLISKVSALVLYCIKFMEVF